MVKLRRQTGRDGGKCVFRDQNERVEGGAGRDALLSGGVMDVEQKMDL